MMDRPSKIVCVGRDFAEHAKELGNDVPQAVGRLVPGDVVEVEIPGVDTLRNPVGGPNQ